MIVQQTFYSWNNIFFAVNAQNFIDVFKIKIPFRFWQRCVNMRSEFFYLRFSFDRCFEYEYHFYDNVVNNVPRLCETDWLQIYAQLFGFAKYIFKQERNQAVEGLRFLRSIILKWKRGCRNSPINAKIY